MRGAAIFQSSNLNVVGIFTYYVLDAIAERLGISPLHRVRNLLKYGSMRKLQLYSRGRRKDNKVGLGGRRCVVSRLENSEQLCYVSILASTGERRGGWPFFDDDLLCLSSKASSIRPISKERRMDSIVSWRNPASPSSP